MEGALCSPPPSDRHFREKSHRTPPPDLPVLRNSGGCHAGLPFTETHIQVPKSPCLRSCPDTFPRETRYPSPQPLSLRNHEFNSPLALQGSKSSDLAPFFTPRSPSLTPQESGRLSTATPGPRSPGLSSQFPDSLFTRPQRPGPSALTRFWRKKG